MTTAIAEIGFVADSSQLNEATAALNRLSAAAGRTEQAAAGATASTAGVGAAAAGSRSGLLAFVAGISLLIKGLITLAVAGVAAIAAMVKFGDMFTEISIRLGAAVGGAHLAQTALIELTQIAVRNGESIKTLSDRYAQMSTSLYALGLSAKQSIDFISGVSNALNAAGVKGAEAQTLWQNLNNILSSNKVTYEQLNKVLQSGGIIAELLAKQLGTTVGGLRELAKEGKITGDDLAKSVLSNLKLLREEADKTPQTVSEALTGFGTAFGFLFAELDRATGVSQFFSRVIQSVTGVVMNMAEGVENLFLGIGSGISRAWFSTKTFFSNMGNLVIGTSMEIVNIMISLINDVVLVAIKGLNYLMDRSNAIVGTSFAAINENFKLIEPFPKMWIDALKRGSQEIGPWSVQVARAVGGLEAPHKRTTMAVDETAKAYEKLMATARKREQVLRSEYKSLFENALQTEILKEQTKLLSEAQEKGINIDEKRLASMIAQGDALGRWRNAIDQTRASLDFAKDVFGGFVRDLRDGLMRGEGFLKAFANAALNVLNKISNKLIDLALDMAFASKSGGGGGMSWLAQLFKGLFPGSGTSSAGWTPVVTPTPNAKGNAFGNGIFDSPQLFAFAKGAALGVMGEAGPEAVMPLKRGPDGSLGVQVNGSSSDGPAVLVQVINNAPDTNVREERSTGSNGQEIRRIVIDTIRQATANGDMDGAMKSRFGSVPSKITRG